jgi:lipid-A-disaccharide synthase-like uncharacterized protein
MQDMRLKAAQGKAQGSKGLNMSVILGIIGAVILAIAWIPETVQIIRERKSRLNKGFEIFYFVGTLLLFLYALIIADAVFAFVNGFILFQVCINVYFTFGSRKKSRTKKK